MNVHAMRVGSAACSRWNDRLGRSPTVFCYVQVFIYVRYVVRTQILFGCASGASVFAKVQCSTYLVHF
jgi:hypothetical protein